MFFQPITVMVIKLVLLYFFQENGLNILKIYFSQFYTISMSIFSEIKGEIKNSGNGNPDFQQPKINFRFELIFSAHPFQAYRSLDNKCAKFQRCIMKCAILLFCYTFRPGYIDYEFCPKSPPPSMTLSHPQPKSHTLFTVQRQQKTKKM